MARYVVIDADGKFENLILWDEQTNWSPPAGHAIVLEDSEEGQAAIAAETARREAEQEALRTQNGE